MAQLRQTDRDALVLRYFENKSFKEVGTALGVEERAAQKRVARSLEKLRSVFVRRGVTASAVSLAGIIAASSVQAAPAHLAASVAAAAGKGAAGGALPVLVKGVLKLMVWQKAKAAILAGAAMVLATGTTSLVVKAVSSTQASASPGLQGAWESTGLKGIVPFGPLPTVDLHTVLKITMTNGVYRASLDFIELGIQDYPVTAFSCKNGTVRLQLNALGRYEGTVDPSGAQIRGWFNWWDGSRLEVLWKQTTHPDVPAPPLAESEYAPAANSILQGFWGGQASFKGIPLRMNLKVAEPSPGSFRAEMELPDVGLKHVPLTLDLDKPTVRFTMLGAELEGRLSSSNTDIEGTMPNGSGGIRWMLKRGKWEPQGDLSFTAKTDLQGHWQGIRTIKGIKYRCFLDIARLPDGKFSASLDCPDAGVGGGTATAVRYHAPQARIEWVWMGSSFEGTLYQGELSGVWNSRLGSSRVVFQRKER